MTTLSMPLLGLHKTNLLKSVNKGFRAKTMQRKLVKLSTQASRQSGRRGGSNVSSDYFFWARASRVRNDHRLPFSNQSITRCVQANRPLLGVSTPSQSTARLVTSRALRVPTSLHSHLISSREDPMACGYPAKHCSVNPHDPGGHFFYPRFNIPYHLALLFPYIEAPSTPYISKLWL